MREVYHPLASSTTTTVMDEKSKPIERIDNPGIRAEGPLLHGLRREVAHLLGRSQLGFPGAQPVSFAQRHLHDLMEKE